MTGEVEIANLALGLLGAATIINLNEDDPKAIAMRVAFPLVRDAELRRRRWKFSLARHALPAESTAPAFGFKGSFVLPSGCLRVIQVGEFDLGPNMADYRSAPTDLYSIEGRRILTDLSAPLKIRTIQQITDTTLWDSAFVEAFAAALAHRCCYRITQSHEREDRVLVAYKTAMREAARANALESAPSESTDDTWVMSRISA